MKKSDIKFKVDHQILVKFLKMTIKIGEIEGKSARKTKTIPNNFDGNTNQIPHNDILSLVIEDLVGEIKIGRDMNQLKTPTAISVDAKMSRLCMTDLQKSENFDINKKKEIKSVIPKVFRKIISNPQIEFDHNPNEVENDEANENLSLRK